MKQMNKSIILFIFCFSSCSIALEGENSNLSNKTQTCSLYDSILIKKNTDDKSLLKIENLEDNTIKMIDLSGVNNNIINSMIYNEKMINFSTKMNPGTKNKKIILDIYKINLKNINECKIGIDAPKVLTVELDLLLTNAELNSLFTNTKKEPTDLSKNEQYIKIINENLYIYNISSEKIFIIENIDKIDHESKENIKIQKTPRLINDFYIYKYDENKLFFYIDNGYLKYFKMEMQKFNIKTSDVTDSQSDIISIKIDGYITQNQSDLIYYIDNGNLKTTKNMFEFLNANNTLEIVERKDNEEKKIVREGLITEKSFKLLSEQNFLKNQNNKQEYLIKMCSKKEPLICFFNNNKLWIIENKSNKEGYMLLYGEKKINHIYLNEEYDYVENKTYKKESILIFKNKKEEYLFLFIEFKEDKQKEYVPMIRYYKYNKIDGYIFPEKRGAE